MQKLIKLNTTLANTCIWIATLMMCLFSNRKILDDTFSLFERVILDSNKLHLLPNHIYVKFDCIHINMMIGMSVKTNDAVKRVIERLMREIRRVPEQIYYHHLKGTIVLNLAEWHQVRRHLSSSQIWCPLYAYIYFLWIS